jgi:two-component system, sensor histidine kinase
VDGCGTALSIPGESQFQSRTGPPCMITPPEIHHTDWSTPARTDWVIRERIAYERVATMVEATPFPIIVGVAFAAVCATVLLRVASPAAVGLWFGCLALLTVLRVLQTRRFLADPQRKARASHWQNRYMLLMLPYTLTWASMLVLTGPRIGGFVFSFVIVGLLGVASAGMYTVQSVFRASAAWLLSITMPVVAWCIWRGDTDGAVLGLGALLFTGVLLHQSLRSSRTMGETLRLRLENTAIAEDRAQALQLAEQSSRAKTRFLATVSHEMRTPLNGIIGISELLRDESAEPGVRERAAVVLASAEQLNRVIGDLLDLSRLEFGRLALEPTAVDPVQLLREVVAAARPAAEQRGLALEVKLAAALPHRVSADATRVKQVLNCLLSNALRYTTEGRVEISLAPSPLGLRFVVTDTGPGVAPERLATIFEPFNQTGSEAGADRAGMGLGLSIARRLARAMNGELQHDAAPERGARFIFTLQAPVLGTAGDDPEEPTAPLRFQGHVLVVDDNEVNALVAQAMLQRLGLSTDTARDGQQALEQLQRGVHQLALMDCRMPTLDGWEATRRWREHENRHGSGPRLPIVGVTANVSAADRLHCEQAGMDGFLAKPFRLQELVEVLRPHLPVAEVASSRQSPA